MNFFSRYKKILAIIGFLFLVVVMAYLIWLVFFYRETEITPPETIPTPSGGLPQAGPDTDSEIPSGGGPGTLPVGQISGPPDPSTPSPIAIGGLTRTEKLTDSAVLKPTLSKNGGVQYYDPKDGKFYRIDENGQATLMLDKVFYDVQNITWAPNKDKAILEYPDGNKILYNFSTKKQVTLPNHWQDFSFSPDSAQIISKSIGLDPENNWLVVSNDDGSKARAIENIGTNGDSVYSVWSPNNQIVAMYTDGLDFNRQELYFVGLNNENLKSTIIEGRGFQPEWSTDGNRLLYSVYSTDTNLNPKLWVVDSSGDSISQNRRSLEINTWASKCTFSSSATVYCAVPEYLERGAGLFPELADQTKDNLYKIDLANNSRELIAVPDGTYNISDVIVPADNGYIFFTDKKTGQLYKIKLP